MSSIVCAYASRFAASEPAGAYSRYRLEHLAAEVPIALYTGGRSHPALRAITAALATQIARARLTDIATAGHAVQMAGQEFLAPLLEFVAMADAEWVRRGSLGAGGGRR